MGSKEGPVSLGWRRQKDIVPQTVVKDGRLAYTFREKHHSFSWTQKVLEVFDTLTKEEKVEWQKQMAEHGLSKTFGSPVEEIREKNDLKETPKEPTTFTVYDSGEEKRDEIAAD